MKKTFTKLLFLLGAFLLLGTGSARAWYWSIMGDTYGWSDSDISNYMVTQDDNGSASLFFCHLGGKFQIWKCGDKWGGGYQADDKYSHGSFVKTGDVPAGFTITEESSCSKMSYTLYDVRIDLTFEGGKDNLYCSSLVVNGSSSPSVYIYGDWGDGASWGSDYLKGIKLTQGADGVWRGTFTTKNADNNYFRFRYHDYNYGPSTSKNEDQEVKGGNNVMVESTNNTAKSYNLKGKGTYEVEFTIPTSGMPTFILKRVLYLRGTMTDDWKPTEYWKFSSEDGVNYYMSGKKIEKGENFKVSDADWSEDATYTKNETLNANQDYDLSFIDGEGNNMVMGETVTNAAISYNNDTHKFRIDYAPITDTKKISTIYVIGKGDGLTEKGYNIYPVNKEVKENADDYYRFTVSNLESFRVSVDGSSQKAFDMGSFAPVAEGSEGAIKVPISKAFGNGVAGERGQTLSTAPSTVDIVLPWKDEYEITIDERLTTINVRSINETESQKHINDVYLYIVKNGKVVSQYGEEATDEEGKKVSDFRIPFARIYDGNETELITSLEIDNDFEFYIEHNGVKYGNGQTVQIGGNNVTLTTGNNTNKVSNANTNTPVLITYYPNSHQIKMAQRTANLYRDTKPESIFMYGHLNDYAWDPNNYYELKPKTDAEGNVIEGVYSADMVSIRGSWQAGDLSKVNDRVLYNSTGDENYVSFFTQQLTTNKYDGYKLSTYNEPRYQNMPVYNDYQKEPVIYISGRGDSNNFQVAEGIYYVEVNLNDMTVIFRKKPADYKKPVTMEWYVGGTETDSSKATKAEDQSRQVFRNTGAVMQIGVEDKPTHRVARQVVYKVTYLSSNSKGKNVKRRDTGTANEIYGDGDNNVVTFLGDENYDTNHLIKFNEPGKYEITPMVHVDAVGIDAYDIEDAEKMTVYVGLETTLTTDGTNHYAPFGTNGTTTFANLFALDDELVYGTDFTVELTATNATGWKTGSSYEDALTQGLYYQYLDIVSPPKTEDGDTETSETNDTETETETVAVDGFYDATAVKVVGATVNDDSAGSVTSYSYDLAVNVPCSGTYQVVIKPTDTSSHTFEQQTIALQVYPNLYGYFGNEAGFNIGGYGFEKKDYASNAVRAIVLPTKDTNSKKPINYATLIAYCPGTYFVNNGDFNVTIPGSETTTQAPRKVQQDEGYPYVIGFPIDMSDIVNYSDETPMDISVTISKNEASHTYQFTAYTANSGFNTSTGVEAIGEAEGEAEYYTIQGVKVQNPEHGIYIKIQNGKATKVLL